MTSFSISGMAFGDRTLVGSDLGEVLSGGTLMAGVSMDDTSILRIYGALQNAGNGVTVVAGATDIGIDVFSGGSITGTATGIYGAEPFGGDIRNGGSISGSVAGISTSYLAGDWMIQNFGSITSGSAAISVGISGIGAKISIYNTGTIEGTFWGVSCKTELYLENSGTISGATAAIVTLGSNDVVSNAGTITGLIDLEHGNNIFDGSSGWQDRVRTGNGDDILFGGLQDETLTSLAGKDTISGAGGRDTILGGSGNDVLFGGLGNDKLTGGTGRDLLAGDGGSDRFIFRSGDGIDVVSDFLASGRAHDILDLRLVVAISSFADLRANHMTQSGSDVVIRGNTGDVITLSNVRIGQLDAGDFLF